LIKETDFLARRISRSRLKKDPWEFLQMGKPQATVATEIWMPQMATQVTNPHTSIIQSPSTTKVEEVEANFKMGVLFCSAKVGRMRRKKSRCC